MNTEASTRYEISATAKINKGVIAHEATLAGDAQNIYILDKDTQQITFTLPLSQVKKAYAQLGQLYIKYGFGKMITVNFVTLDAGNIATTVVNSTVSSTYHAAQAQEVQGDVQKWLDYFSKHDIKAKQTLSPTKFIIIVIIVSIILFAYRLFGSN